jgi:hypothetical protein
MRLFVNKCIWILIVLPMFYACEKAEKPVVLPPKPSDSLMLFQVNLGENYEDQVYIDFLDSNFIKASVKNKDWDLAFDCSLESNRIFMNGGKGVFIGILGHDDFLNKVDLNSVKWRWDEASGGDSIVLRNWFHAPTRKSFDSIYIIDRGTESEPDKRYFQFKLTYGSFGTYIIEAADLNGKKVFSAFINKDPYKAQVYLNFGKPQILNFEPKLYDWQFCFLKARWIYYEFNPPLIYTVTGVHINNRIVSVAVDSSLNFETIRKKDVEQLKFSSQRDVVGFDWKVYNFNNGHYMARRYVNYIFRFKGPNPKYYKLRFTDYYSKQGLKGSPKFEVMAIN